MTAPQQLPPERAKLARELAALRERTGLSLAALSERTTASKSSWQRYLNGSKLPPRGLVRELCELAGRPPGPLLALWELAEAAPRTCRPPAPAAAGGPDGPTGGAASASVPPASTAPPAASAAGGAAAGAAGPGPAPARPPHRPPHRRALTGAAVAVVLLGLVATVAALLGGSRAEPEEPPPVRAGCHGEDCTGEPANTQACGIAASRPRSVAERTFGTQTRVDIRYSPVCAASWGRVWFGEVGDVIELRAPGRPVQSVEIVDRYDAEGYLVTPMIAGGPKDMTACLVRPDKTRTCFTS